MSNMELRGISLPLSLPTKPDPCPTEILSLPDLLDLDTYLVVKPHGFASRDEYVEKASSARLAHNIAVPTLALNARDDPICPSSYVRRSAVRLCIEGTQR